MTKKSYLIIEFIGLFFLQIGLGILLNCYIPEYANSIRLILMVIFFFVYFNQIGRIRDCENE